MQTQWAVNAERLLQTFLDLVQLDSPSGDEGPVRDYLVSWFQTLGFSIQAADGGNFLVHVPGTAQGKQLTLMMTGHMDVVPPCLGVKPLIDGHGEERCIRSSGDTVLGADDKAGLAAMLEALQLSLEERRPYPNLLFVITTREEVMLQGAKEIAPHLYAEADFGIALDHTGAQGTIIYEAPTYYEYKMTVHGKSVHAGIMPEKGINAIQLLSQALVKLPFGRLDENTTCNLSFLRGGKATNVVPDLAVAEGEIRGHDEARLQQHIALMKQAIDDVVSPIEGASGQMEIVEGFHQYRTDPAHPLLQRVVRAVEKLNLPANLIRTNGGSDMNVFAQQNLPGIVLSAGYIAPHSLKERVHLKDMVRATQLILSVWEEFAQ